MTEHAVVIVGGGPTGLMLADAGPLRGRAPGTGHRARICPTART
jgi:NADPH-dependent 2,4-dienoyl-CoA reductase/sulfur reductase-like enzyme